MMTQYRSIVFQSSLASLNNSNNVVTFYNVDFSSFPKKPMIGTLIFREFATGITATGNNIEIEMYIGSGFNSSINTNGRSLIPKYTFANRVRTSLNTFQAMDDPDSLSPYFILDQLQITNNTVTFRIVNQATQQLYAALENWIIILHVSEIL